MPRHHAIRHAWHNKALEVTKDELRSPLNLIADVGPEENEIRRATTELDCFGRLMIPGLTMLALKGCCRRCHGEDKVERNDKGNHAVRLFQMRKHQINCQPTNHDVTLQLKGFWTNKSFQRTRLSSAQSGPLKLDVRP